MTISDLDFEDDVCLLKDDFNAAQELLSSVIAAAGKMDLTIDAKKTQAMFSNHALENLKCGDDVLENVSNFNYLGSTITDNDINKKHQKPNCESHHQLKKLSNF